MTTDDLLARLARDPPTPPLQPLRMAAGIILAVALPVAMFLLLFGTRPGLAVAWANPVVPFKTLLPLVTCGLSLVLLLRLARPEARPGLMPLGYLLPGALALALWIGAFTGLEPARRFADVRPASLAECLGVILLLSAVPAVLALRILRRGASTRPALSAAMAGLTAASGAAAGYSLFCTRDNPLFFVTWYGAAVLIVTLVTARAGARQLHW